MPQYNGLDDFVCITGTGLVDFIHDKLIYECRAKSHFITFKVNIKIPMTGKYFYQMILGNGNLAQIGFGDDAFDPQESTGSGVGDDGHSWGVDGYRVLKWCNGSEEYGQKWTGGDLLTCAIDMDKKICIFYINDICLGVAFENMNISGDIYPCFTLGNHYQSQVQLLLHSKLIKDGPWIKDGYKPLILSKSSFQREINKQAIIKFFGKNEINGKKFIQMGQNKFVKELSAFLKREQADLLMETAWHIEEKKEDDDDDDDDEVIVKSKTIFMENEELNPLYNLMKKYFMAIRANADKENNKLLEETISQSNDSNKLGKSLCILVKNLQKYEEFKDKKYWKIEQIAASKPD
eukprot:429718_1